MAMAIALDLNPDENLDVNLQPTPYKINSKQPCGGGVSKQGARKTERMSAPIFMPSNTLKKIKYFREHKLENMKIVS